jgi:hypothetical protein
MEPKAIPARFVATPHSGARRQPKVHLGASDLSLERREVSRRDGPDEHGPIDGRGQAELPPRVAEFEREI